ncbi:UNVERIFIED_CONTAM: hypothetical protein BEN50_23780 [Euhalothece sp. KZN 001]
MHPAHPGRQLTCLSGVVAEDVRRGDPADRQEDVCRNRAHLGVQKGFTRHVGLVGRLLVLGLAEVQIRQIRAIEMGRERRSVDETGPRQHSEEPLTCRVAEWDLGPPPTVDARVMADHMERGIGVAVPWNEPITVGTETERVRDAICDRVHTGRIPEQVLSPA